MVAFDENYPFDNILLLLNLLLPLETATEPDFSK